MRRYLRATDGAAAAEFAMILPVFLLFTFGLIFFGMLMFTTNQLHWTVAQAARCASVSTSCKTGGVVGGAVNNSTVVTYAKAVYKGLSAANFSYVNTGACSRTGTGSTNSGYQVSGNATFILNVGVARKTIPISSSACFP